ncbi:MAG: tRNA lysidine(34) synthetase TilS [Chitinivibrionales bacterium]|nr:tRNA lysidine(34) synthetase TilS [Chitinivibrionales bacterium]
MCEKAVIEFFSTHSIRPASILCAVSAGCDSTALFHILAAVASKIGCTTLAIAHINHGLRGPESDEDELFVRRLAAAYAVPFFTTRLSGKTIDARGIEAWGRAARYEFLLSVKERQNFTHIATAHTMDDQAETVIMRCGRGCGGTGLSGIAPYRPDGVIRPLLSLQRYELEAWMKVRGFSWREDSSNKECHFYRNRIRHRFMPRLAAQQPDAVRILAALATNCRQQMLFLDTFARQWIAEHYTYHTNDRFVLSKDETRQKLDFIIPEALALLFKKHDINFDRQTINHFLRDSAQTAGTFLLSGGWSFFPSKSIITVERRVTVGTPKQVVPVVSIMVPTEVPFCIAALNISVQATLCRKEEVIFDPQNNEVFSDAALVGSLLCVRVISSDDLFQPLGYAHPLSALRYLKKRGITQYYRQRMVVVTDRAGAIIWIPTVAIAAGVAISDSTMSILRMSLRLLQ